MMDVALKKIQSFRLSIDLIERLKKMAKLQNRSLNNFVETVLLDVAFHVPNAETISAMNEAESGLLRNEPELDLSSIEAMEKSMGL
ncbi:MAG: toxin-antitoxin system protein [Bacteroidales bacterium]|nr:toxin-antitoxin system protein [Bacteroidales bacterium]